MTIILGANGHVGSATAQALLNKGKEILVVLHSDDQAAFWKQQGAKAVVSDVKDAYALNKIFQQGENAFILNPPAPPHLDAAAEELRSVDAILKALQASGLKKIVAQSTYGAQPGKSVGDLSVLFQLEEGLRNQGIPTIILRGAYYMSNWDLSLKSANREGVVHTFYPVDFTLPMVAPQDLGKYAAEFLLESDDANALHFVEGPQEYSTLDVAATFSNLLGKEVRAVETPSSEWKNSLLSQGFSEASATSFVRMIQATLDGKERPANVLRGKTTLQEYISQLISR